MVIWVAFACQFLNPTPNTVTPQVPRTETPSPQTALQLTEDIATERVIDPDELLPFISWGGWGGGDNESDCGDGVPNINIDPNDGGEPLTDEYYPDVSAGVLGMQFIIEGCDYFPGEAVEVTFYLPDDTVEFGTVDADQKGNWEVVWWSFPGEPLGTYYVEANSFSGFFQGSFSVSQPTRPVLIASCPFTEWGEIVVVTGFQPNEEILLALYGTMLVDYGYFRVDAEGAGVVNLPVPENPESGYLVLAIGQETPLNRYAEDVTDGLAMKISAYDYYLGIDGGDFCSK